MLPAAQTALADGECATAVAKPFPIETRFVSAGYSYVQSLKFYGRRAKNDVSDATKRNEQEPALAPHYPQSEQTQSQVISEVEVLRLK